MKNGSQTFFANVCIKAKLHNMGPTFFWLLLKESKIHYKNVTTVDEKNGTAFNGIVL